MKVRIGTIAILLLLVAAALAAFVVSGVYNIAATRQHTPPVFWLMQYAMRQSVRLHSEGTDIPNLNGAQRIRDGMILYRAHCSQCHGAPGVAPNEVGRGLTPAPANLVAAGRDWPPAEIYWVVRHGIKMTGMPAWSYRLSESELWDVVAFVKQLPTLSPKEYANMIESLPPKPMKLTQTATAAPSKALNGDIAAGKQAIQQYLCATCHRIPGITGAVADVGPTLAGIATRRYIAGVLPNTRANMLTWLENPKQVDPLSAMPDLGITEDDARNIAAYLYTLEDPD